MLEFGTQALTLWSINKPKKSKNKPKIVHCGFDNRNLEINQGHFLKDKKGKPLLDDSENIRTMNRQTYLLETCVLCILITTIMRGYRCPLLHLQYKLLSFLVVWRKVFFSVVVYHGKPESGEQSEGEIHTTVLHYVILPASQVQRIVVSPPHIYQNTGFFRI